MLSQLLKINNKLISTNIVLIVLQISPSQEKIKPTFSILPIF